MKTISLISFKSRAAFCVLRPHDDGYSTRRYFFGHAGDDLAWQVDRKSARGLILGTVGGFEEYALCAVFFVNFDFLAFDDDIISYGERAVF